MRRWLERLRARFEPASRRALTIEPTEQNESGRCDCCGDVTRRAWGFLHAGETTEAAYLVEWTAGKIGEHGAYVDLVVGRWGDDSPAADRVAVSLEFRHTDTGPSFSVIDSANREVSRSELVGRAMKRDEVIGTPLAQRVFDMVDVVWTQDDRILEVTRVTKPA